MSARLLLNSSSPTSNSVSDVELLIGGVLLSQTLVKLQWRGAEAGLVIYCWSYTRYVKKQGKL